MSAFFVRLGCWALLLAGSFQARSQKPGDNLRFGANDSTLAMLKRPGTHDTVRVILLSQLVALVGRTDMAAAKRYGEQGIALGQRIGYRKFESSNLNNLGAICFGSGDYPAAQRYFAASVVLGKQLKQPAVIGLGHVGLGNVARALGNHRRALQHFEQARQSFAKDQPYPKNQPHLDAVHGQMLVLSNMATTYADLKDTVRAYQMRRQALALNIPGDTTYLLGMALSGLATSADQFHQYDSCQVLLNQALRVSRAIRDEVKEASIHESFALLYLHTHRLPLARQHALVSLQMARKLGDQDREAAALQALADIMHAQGQGAAFDTLYRYLAIHDTLLSHERVEAVVAAQARYDLAGEQARHQLARQRGELDRLRYRQYLAGAAGLGLLALVLTGAGVWRYRRQREQALRAELAAELHDELGSMLTRVTLRAELLETRHSSPQLLALVQESRTAAATVRDIIWSVDTTADTVEALLDRLRATVEAIRRDTEQEVQLTLPDALLPARLRATVRQQVYLIGKESLTNALRHGLRHGPLALSLHLDAKELLLCIENDTRTEATGPDGQGLRSMQARAAAVGGTLQAGPQPGGGWQVLLRVPRPLA